MPPLYSKTNIINATHANTILAMLLPIATKTTTVNITTIEVVIENIPYIASRIQVIVALVIVAIFTKVFKKLGFLSLLFDEKNIFVFCLNEFHKTFAKQMRFLYA